MVEATTEYYDHIYLSPHLDDVALSCGGQVWLQTTAGRSVLIVTITAGDPPTGGYSPLAQALHERWLAGAGEGATLEAIVAARRAEDRAACRVLGADYCHLPFLDCIYRRDTGTGRPLYASNDDLFGPVAAADAFTIEQVAKALAKLPQRGNVYVPLGVGNHVDHQITRQAAEQCFERRLVYYEEYPYVAQPEALDKAIPAAKRGDWQTGVTPLSAAALRNKTAAVAAFASQVGTFFADQSDMASQLESQAASVASQPQDVGGERYWRQVTPA